MYGFIGIEHVFIVQIRKQIYIVKFVLIMHVFLLQLKAENLDPAHNSVDECLDRKVYM